MRPIRVFIFLLIASAPLAGFAEAPDAIDPLAIFRKECVSCHTESKRKGGFLIESRESLLEGGDTGPAIVPGKANESYLVETLYPDADSHMPPKGQLDPREIAAIEEWINAGAKWDSEHWARLNLPEKMEVTRGTMPDSYAPVVSMALSPDAKLLVAGRGNQIEWYRLTPGEGENPPLQLEHFHSSSGHSDLVQSLAFSPDGKTIASGGFRSLRIWSIDAPDKPTRTIEEPFLGRQTALLFLDDKRLLVADSVPSQLGRLHEITLADGKTKSFDSAHLDSIYSLTRSRSGNHYATTSADKLITVRDSKSHEIVNRLEGHTGFVITAAFGPEDKRIATGGDDEEIKVWNLETGKKVSAFASKRCGPLYGLEWLVDPENQKKRAEEKDPEKAKEINTDRIFAVSESGKPAAFIELNEHEGEQRSTGARERPFDTVEVPLFAMTVHPERQWLIAGGEDGRIFVWDEKGKLKQTWEPSTPEAPKLAAKDE